MLCRARLHRTFFRLGGARLVGTKGSFVVVILSTRIFRLAVIARISALVRAMGGICSGVVRVLGTSIIGVGRTRMRYAQVRGAVPYDGKREANLEPVLAALDQKVMQVDALLRGLEGGRSFF